MNRKKYFGINDKPMGVSTSYRVSGRLGEVATRVALYPDAELLMKRLNRAYELGMRHGFELKRSQKWMRKPIKV